MIKTCIICKHRHFNDSDFCSIKCGLSTIEPGKKQQNVSQRIISCQQCGKEFTRNNKNQMFCSQQCYREDRKSHENEIRMIEIECPECGKKYISEISGYFKSKKNQFCLECQKKFGRKTTRLYTRTNTDEEHPDLVMSQTEVSEIMGITKQAVSLSEKNALKKFKKNFEKMYPDTVGLIKLDSERYGKLKNSVRLTF